MKIPVKAVVSAIGFATLVRRPSFISGAVTSTFELHRHNSCPHPPRSVSGPSNGRSRLGDEVVLWLIGEELLDERVTYRSAQAGGASQWARYRRSSGGTQCTQCGSVRNGRCSGEPGRISCWNHGGGAHLPSGNIGQCATALLAITAALAVSIPQVIDRQGWS